MTSTVLPITLTIATAATVLHIWLAGRVSAVRNSQKVSIGDGGNEALIRRMRAHANYTENAPFALILLALVELAGGDPRVLWGAAILFVAARLLHAFGMDRAQPSKLRMFGMLGSIFALLILAGYAIFIVYRHPPAL